MDIGGGTSNLSLIREGKILRTGCLNVGGRLVKFSELGEITDISPVLSPICQWKIGEIPTAQQREALAETLTEALEMAAGRREASPLLEQLMTEEASAPWIPPEETIVVSFSGGVADCIREEFSPMAFGDLGPELGRAISRSNLCRGAHILGAETIRATVIGAGCHTTQLSGSTVYYQNLCFPLKNLPVWEFSGMESGLAPPEGPVIVSLEGVQSPSYRQIRELAQQILSRLKPPILLCLQQDMAKALGQALAVRLPPGTPVLCIDRIRVGSGSYLDIGAPVGNAMPVVVKTLVFSK